MATDKPKIGDPENRAQVRFYCRRGMCELEDILYPFFDGQYENLTVDQQHAFATLLSSEDNELWQWLVTKESEPPEPFQEIVKIIHDSK